ncbi:MAX gene-associated protein [Lissotriton helveticus]
MTEKKPVPTMEKSQTTLGKKDNAPSSGTSPALFVLLQQPQGNDKSEPGISVSDQDADSSSTDAPAIASVPSNPKSKACLAANCKIAGITVVLDNNTMWNEFYRRSTEMILTKQGRRMFPYCRYWITGLDPNLKYILVMDIAPVDNQRYKWNGRWWEPSGKAEPHVLGRVFIHPESPSTGQYWMHQPVSFYKLKLTNNYLDQEGHIILHSMHRYLPRLHLVPAERATEVIQLNGPDVHTFTFPQTEFFAVTAYQNIQITQLKIDYNPFAKGFREDALVSKPFKDVLARVRSDLEGASDSTSPNTHGQVENHSTDSLKKDEGSLVGSHDKLDGDIEKDSFTAERDFLTLINPDVAIEDVKRLKQESLASTQPSSVVNCSRVTSPLDSSGLADVVIKEEPVDDCEKTTGTDVVVVKSEDSEEEDTDEYSNSDESYPILERQLMKQSAMDRASQKRPCKRTLKSPSGIAKAKILKLESGNLPVIDVETCNNKTDVSEAAVLEDYIDLTGKQAESLDKETDLSASVEESLITSMNSSQSKASENIVSENKKSKCSLPTNAVENNSESSRRFDEPETPVLFPRDSADSPTEARVTKKRKSTPTLKYQESLNYGVDELTPPVSPVRRGRPRKTKFSKVSRQPKKSFGKLLEESQKVSPAKNDAFSNANLDLEDVDGVLFASFVSKEALDIHTVDVPAVGKELQSSLTSSAFENTDDGRKIAHLEKQLLDDLKSLRHKQVIHPALQEVGLKLGVVDPTMSIDLQYLGVQLPLSYFCTSGLEDDSVLNHGQAFISRTGKTTDVTKIKGWRDKFSTNTSSNTEGVSGAPMKNRSAFCSDKLDEYLENEAKLMESDLDLPPDVAPPINYQLPTKSTSYVRTLDSVLKKQSTSSPFSTLKTLSSPPARKQVRGRSKLASSSTKAKRVYRRIMPSNGKVKEKYSLQSVLTKTATSHSINPPANMIHKFLLPALDESMLPKQINLARAQQQQQNSARFPGVSKSYLKLIDLEECAVWEGKPRTYITEDRADVSLATLLTAQVSLKSKPVRKIIQRRAPACNNEFCRLGCICASISQEKREPTHCRRPECMFGCTCLKRKMMLVRGGPKDTTTIKEEDEDNLLSETIGQDPHIVPKEEKPESEEDENSIYGSHPVKLEYTICDTEPEEPIRKSFSIWEKGESDEDPEPIYIPKPSVSEPAHSGTLDYTSSTRSKPGRIYTPKPNPVVRDEDKDPVYLYFENMMTCARVRAYERKTKEHQKQMSDQCTCGSSQCIAKDHYPEHQLKGTVSKMEKAKGNSTDKSWRLTHSKTNTSISRVHKISSGGPTKLIEIISDCNWEEDRNTILNILSQQINSNMPRSLKVGNFIVELASEGKNRDEKHPPFVSSRVKISMPSCQVKDEDDEMSELENSEIGSLSSSCRKAEITGFPHDDTSDTIPEKSPSCKGLPFYTGLSPAGRLVANKHAPDSNASGLIQVNGKSYPQAKLLLGQMGALHPANRLAAYITGRLRPTVLDLSTLSTVISKVSSSSKTSTPLTTVTTSVTKPTVTFSSSSNTASNTATLTFTAARPSSGGVYTQFLLNKAGSLQQKIPVVGTPQPVSGTQKFNVSPTSYVVVTPVATSRSCQVFTTTPTTRMSTLPTPSSTLSAPLFTAATLISKVNTNELVSPTTTPAKNPAVSSPGKLQSPAGFDVPLASQTINTTSPTTVSSATVTSTKATVKFPTIPVTPLTPLSFARTIVNTSTIPLPVNTHTSASLVATTKATTFVTTSSSSTSGATISSVPILLSGINSLSQKTGAGSQASVAVSSTPILSPGTEKRAGPRLLLIPVPSGSPTVRPVRNVQLAQGQKMVLQPFRNPGGVNLFRHPNGQIVQLVPLQQLRAAAGSQPKAQPLLLRNPGSVMGIQLPLPSKISEASKQLPTSTSSFVLSSPVVSTKVANVVSSSTNKAISHSAASLSSVPSFVSQAGTLTLRISPPTSSNLAPGQSNTNSKIITYSTAGQPMGSASLVPLQSGSFALLQLPGQKPVPSSILNHAASLQLLKDTKTASQKEQQDLNGQPDLKTSSSEEEAATMREKKLLETSRESGEKHVASEVTNFAENLQEDLSAVSVQKISHTSQSGTLENTTDQKSRLSKDIVETDNREQESPTPKEINEFEEQKVCLDSYNKEQVELSGFSDSECAVEHSSSSADCSTVVSRKCADAGDPVKVVSTGKQNRKESNNGKENGASAVSLCKTNSEANNQVDKPNEPVCNDGKGNTSKQQDHAEECFSELADHENHVNTTQKCCQEQMENKPESSSIKVESEIIEDHVTDNLATSTSYVPETKTSVESHHSLNNSLEENGGSEKGFTLSRNLTSSPCLVSEHIRNEKKVMSISHEELGESSSHPLVPDVKAEPSQLKKTLVLINIDKEEYEEEDDKSDDSADDLMEDASSDEDVKVDVNEFAKDDEEQVDIETVEELSEKFNIARLKAKAYIESSRQQCMFHNLLADQDRNVSNWKKKTDSEANPFKYYRETHTANERRRRLEMRSLFENLQKMLGLNLPKVSKSYILTQAYEEIQGLTDQADKLIGQKNLLTRKQDILIRKVSALSGKTEEVVLKKLEYIYAKQKALDAQRKKRQKGEEELAQQLRPSRLLKQELSLESLRHVEQFTFSNQKRLKPLILARKPQQVGMTSMVIQLPGSSVPIQLKGIITNPITLSSTTNSNIAPTMSRTAQLPTESDDVFMMPKIVNVTSLADEPAVGLKLRLEKTPSSASTVVKASDTTLRYEANIGENMLGKLAPFPGRGVLERCKIESSSYGTQYAQVAITDRDLISKQVENLESTNKAPGNRLPDVKSLAVLHGEEKEIKVENEQSSMKDCQFLKLLSKDAKDLMDVELKHGASSAEDVALHTTELMSAIEEHDDSDETLTSLLNEIAFLNQQLNNDTPDLSLSPKLSLVDSLTGEKEETVENASSVQFSSFRELLEQSEFQAGEKQPGDPSSGDTLNLVGIQKKETSQLSIKDLSVSPRFVADTTSASPPPILQKKTKQELGSADTVWRPMPKLAPLGLKVSNLPADQDGQANKVMPPLAPVTTKLGPLWTKAAVPVAKPGQIKKIMPVLSSVVAKPNDSALPSTITDK